MIPQEQKRRATVMVLLCFGMVAVGVVIGLLWVSTYTTR